MNKIATVTKTLFSTAAKKYPLFFVLEGVKTILDCLRPFVGLTLTPMIVDEICNGRNIKVLATYAAILVITEGLISIIYSAVIMKIDKYDERLKNYFSMKIGVQSMNLDFQLTEDKEALDQLDRAKTGMDWYSGGVYGIAEQIFMFVGNIFKIIGFATVILISAPWMILAIILYVILGSLINARCNKVDVEAFQKLSKINRLFGYFGWNIVDFRYGKDIRLYEAKGMLIERWSAYSKDSMDTWKWQGDNGYKYRKFTVFTDILYNAFLYLYVGLLVMAKKITIGTFTQIIEASGGLNATIGGLVWNMQELVKKCNYAYEYVKFMEYPQAIEKNHDKVEEGLHTIEFKHVSFAYPNTDKLVLDDINIKIVPGEKLSIVGLNGAGKTTFIKLLCRLYDPTSGEILLDGKNIKEYDYKEYMNQFAPVFQDYKLFGFSIAENILLKDADIRSKEEEKEILKITNLVGLDELINKNHKGIDTSVFKIFDEEGVEPSGGEKQKIAIARALYKKSPVIILDEPTAALDPVAEYEIYKQFNNLVGDKTAFYISHRLSSCKFCDKIAVFADGHIAEYGNHDLLVNIKNGIYAKMFEAQAQYYR